MLKKLFFASASVLMLALAYHFGAVNATAQAPGNPVVAYGYAVDNSPYSIVAVTAQGDVYGSTGSLNAWVRGPNVFGGAQPTSPVVAFGLGTFPNRFVVVTAAGDVYGTNYPGDAWVPGQNIFGSATPAQQPTWGELKARYRGERPVSRDR